MQVYNKNSHTYVAQSCTANVNTESSLSSSVLCVCILDVVQVHS